MPPLPAPSSASADPPADGAAAGALRLRRFSAGNRLLGRARRAVAAHPYVAGSIVLHALLAGVLLNLPGMGAAEEAGSRAGDVARTARRVADTELRSLQRQVERMEEIRRMLDADADGPTAASAPAPAGVASSPAALAARAQALADAIATAEQRARAARLAELTGMPLPEAIRKIAAEAPARTASAATATPAQTIARLERQARAALETRRVQVQAMRRGTEVTLPTRAEIAAADAASARASAPRRAVSTNQQRAADGYLRSRTEQLASMIRPGSAQGRVGVVGAAGGSSVNREGVRGVAGGVDVSAADTGPADLTDLPPVTARGASIDLTRAPAPGSHDLLHYVEPAAVDPSTTRRAAGRSFGPGGIFGTRAYIDSWYVIGPFAGQGEPSTQAIYPPEEGVDLDGAYRGLDGRLLTWQYASRGFYPFIPPDRAENAVYYAYTELRMDEDRDVWLAIAGDDDSTLWLDGRLVWISAPGDKPWYHPPFYLPDELVGSFDLAEGQRRVHLARGTHRLLVKLFNDRDRTFFSVVLTP